MTLSAGAYLEKNKLTSTGAWLVLLKIKSVAGTIMRFVKNTENVIWPATLGFDTWGALNTWGDVDTWGNYEGYNTYVAFPFEFDEIGDTSKGEVPQVTIRVSNISRVMESYMEEQDGMVNAEVTLRIVHTTNVTTDTLGTGTNNPDPEIELQFDVLDSSVDNRWATFILGANNPFRMRFPRNRVMRNFCRYKDFKGARCQYTGVETSCDRSLYTCRNTMNNSEHFGGAPGVGSRGVYV